MLSLKSILFFPALQEKLKIINIINKYLLIIDIKFPTLLFTLLFLVHWSFLAYDKIMDKYKLQIFHS